MESITSSTKDYEIDIIIGKIAAIYAAAHSSSRLIWKVAVKGKSIDPISDMIFFTSWVLIPCLYLFFLRRHNIKLTKLMFGIWFFFFLILCWSSTGKFLDNPSGFWKVIFPLALITACMVIGVNGVIRIRDPDRWKIDQIVKIPASYYNTKVLIGSVGTILTLVLTFTFMVFIGKYFSDFVLFHWPSLEQDRKLLFYIGVMLSCYPSRILAAVFPAVTTVLFERIWNLRVRHNTNEPSQHNDPPATD